MFVTHVLFRLFFRGILCFFVQGRLLVGGMYSDLEEFCRFSGLDVDAAFFETFIRAYCYFLYRKLCFFVVWFPYMLLLFSRLNYVFSARIFL